LDKSGSLFGRLVEAKPMYVRIYWLHDAEQFEPGMTSYRGNGEG
jgi:hypothetical protein